MNDECTDEKDLTLELDGNVYEVSAEYFYEVNENYGSDIDGNRGVKIEHLADCNLMSAFKCLEDGTLEEVKDKEMLARLTALAIKHG